MPILCYYHFAPSSYKASMERRILPGLTCRIFYFFEMEACNFFLELAENSFLLGHEPRPGALTYQKDDFFFIVSVFLSTSFRSSSSLAINGSYQSALFRAHSNQVLSSSELLLFANDFVSTSLI